MDNLMLKIPYLTEEEMELKLKEVQEIKDWIDEQWKLCDENKKDGDEVSYLVSEKEKDVMNYLSIYIMSQKMDDLIERKEDEQYDVTKIKVSEETYQKMKEFDTKIYTILHEEFYSQNKIDKDISMIHFMSGFSVDKSINDNNIYILKDVIRKKGISNEL